MFNSINDLVTIFESQDSIRTVLPLSEALILVAANDKLHVSFDVLGTEAVYTPDNEIHRARVQFDHNVVKAEGSLIVIYSKIFMCLLSHFKGESMPSVYTLNNTYEVCMCRNPAKGQYVVISKKFENICYPEMINYSDLEDSYSFEEYLAYLISEL